MRTRPPLGSNNRRRDTSDDFELVSAASGGLGSNHATTGHLDYGMLDEDELLQIALQKSKLEQERREKEQNKAEIPQPHADLQSDEILARSTVFPSPLMSWMITDSMLS